MAFIDMFPWCYYNTIVSTNMNYFSSVLIYCAPTSFYLPLFVFIRCILRLTVLLSCSINSPWIGAIILYFSALFIWCHQNPAPKIIHLTLSLSGVYFTRTHPKPSLIFILYHQFIFYQILCIIYIVSGNYQYLYTSVLGLHTSCDIYRLTIILIYGKVSVYFTLYWIH